MLLQSLNILPIIKSVMFLASVAGNFHQGLIQHTAAFQFWGLLKLEH